ncbi:squalene/phytoene synthase family protein [Gymnodinialimonas sp. 2305UL16-5]|uniref:squalene/phytoene synthase family protein n=1 Tax=Gymnodinialimonas mytili TaxID=3126503 RepID=UPI0030AA563B
MSVQACADLVARADPRRFRAAMAAPLPAREVLLPLYAFNVEVTRAPWLTDEPMIAEMRLQWWRDALGEVAQGRARRHEVVDALAFLDDAGAAILDRLVSARRWDIYKDPFEDAAHFRDYIDQTSGGLIGVGIRALGGAPNEATRAIAYGAGLARYLMAVPDLEARGRVPLVDGRTEAVGELARAALQAWPRKIDLPVSARPALFETVGARVILRRAASQPGAVAAGALEPAPIAERLGLMRAALFGKV